MKRTFENRRVIVFSTGVFIGVTLALVLHHYQTGTISATGQVPNNQYSVDIFQYFFQKQIAKVSSIPSYTDARYNFAYENWLKKLLFGGYSFRLDPDKHRYINNSDITYFEKTIHDNMSGFVRGTEAHFLYNEIPVICVVFSPSSSKSISAVANTWGQHCNGLHFYYSSSRSRGVKYSTKRKANADNNSFLIFNHTNSQNKLLKEKVYVIDVPEAKSEFSLFCRAFHNIRRIYGYSKQVIIKILLEQITGIIHHTPLYICVCVFIIILQKGNNVILLLDQRYTLDTCGTRRLLYLDRESSLLCCTHEPNYPSLFGSCYEILVVRL